MSKSIHLGRTSCAALPLLIGAALCLSHPVRALADEPTALPKVAVDTDQDAALSCPLETTTLNKKAVNIDSVLGASDSAALFSNVAGVSMQTGGGVSSLPIINGMLDDKNTVLVDGMPVTSSCPNHMNPALSYVAPANVGKATVITGVSPVSVGGDSIGGAIIVDPPAPRFGDAADKLDVHGAVGTYFRSNNRQVGTNENVTVANNRFSVGYDGSWARARDGHDGNGDRIIASLFETQTHNATFAARSDNAQVTLRAGHSFTPYEGFSNARMDMLGNSSNYVNGGFAGSYGWGNIDAKVYWQSVKHYMNFLTSERNVNPVMPMYTEGTDKGYSVKAEIPLDGNNILRVGNDLHLYSLNDWWPNANMYPSMGNNDFWNIHDGSRNVLGTYAELEKKWANDLTSVFGIRNDTVWMNTGNVNGYSNCNKSTGMGGCSSTVGAIGSSSTLNYAHDAAAFNAEDHQKTDVNFDVTASTRYDATRTSSYEIGLGRKEQSPNLYERYSWSTGTMASSMISWFGNAADYVGNVDLKTQKANTLRVTGDWHDAEKQDWGVRLTPFYTYVQDYIGVNKLGATSTAGVNVLQFANHDAQIFGFTLSGNKALMRDHTYGDLDLVGSGGLSKGMQMNNGNSLYHMQPLNADVSLNHHWGNLTNSLQVRLVDNKSVTNPLENEQLTPGFAVVNWKAAYELENITFAVGVDNILDKQYYDPNGGAYDAWWRANGSSAAGMGAVPSSGRSYNAGVSVKF